MAKIDDLTIDVAELLETIRAHTARFDEQSQLITDLGDYLSNRITSVGDLAVMNSKKIAALEQQLAILAQGENDNE